MLLLFAEDRAAAYSFLGEARWKSAEMNIHRHCGWTDPHNQPQPRYWPESCAERNCALRVGFI